MQKKSQHGSVMYLWHISQGMSCHLTNTKLKTLEENSIFFDPKTSGFGKNSGGGGSSVRDFSRDTGTPQGHGTPGPIPFPYFKGFLWE